jgi:hypothetical protein
LFDRALKNTGVLKFSFYYFIPKFGMLQKLKKSFLKHKKPTNNAQKHSLIQQTTINYTQKSITNTKTSNTLLKHTQYPTNILQTLQTPTTPAPTINQ